MRIWIKYTDDLWTLIIYLTHSRRRERFANQWIINDISKECFQNVILSFCKLTHLNNRYEYNYITSSDRQLLQYKWVHCWKAYVVSFYTSRLNENWINRNDIICTVWRSIHISHSRWVSKSSNISFFIIHFPACVTFDDQRYMYR